MTTVMMATTNHAAALCPTQKCFLCEVPRGPWAMLFDFSEPVCRACCNYEGVDKISEVLEKAKQLRKSFDVPPAAATPTAVQRQQQQQNSPPAVPPPSHSHLSSPHEQQVLGFVPAVTVNGMNGRPIVAHNQQMRQHPSSPAYMISPRDAMGKMHVVSPIPTTTSIPGFAAIPGMGQPKFSQMQRVNGVVPTSMYSLHNKVHFPPDVKVIPTPDSTTQRFAQIQDTLNTLSKSPPFCIRFSKDHSLIGRVIAFDAVCRGSDYELKVFIEYPVGSGTVFQSASGAGRQMYGEFRERLGIGGGFRGASSNGYKDLEFERVHGDEDWKVLGELLTEEVRFFRGSIKKDLLPTPFLDPNFPELPPASLNATRGFLKNNLLNRKRKSSNEDQDGSYARKEIKTETASRSPENRRSSSPKSPSKSPRHLNGHHSSPLTSPKSPHSPASQGHGSTSPTPSSHGQAGSTSPTPTSATNGDVQVHMECLLCHRTLEDTRFVQCPSMTSHKFCFNCSAENIKTQSSNSSDVYCPSGMKCLVAGNSTPWAFMEQEIKTILSANV